MSATECWECGKIYPKSELLDIPIFNKFTVKWCFKCANKQLGYSGYKIIKNVKN